jgi:hypothetical protein
MMMGRVSFLNGGSQKRERIRVWGQEGAAQKMAKYGNFEEGEQEVCI